MSKGFASNYRAVILVTVVLGCFAAAGWRLVHLHVIDRAELVSFVDQVRQQLIVEKARRGDILDARGDVLATSSTTLTLAIDPWALVDLLALQKTEKRREEVAREEAAKRAELATMLGMSAADLEKFYQPIERPISIDEDNRDGVRDGKTRDRWVKLRENIDEALYAKITEPVPKPLKPGQRPPADPSKVETVSRVPAGLTATRSFVRTYPHNQLAAHVIGYVNKEGVPAVGVERFADFYLRGQDGWRESEKDGLRRELAQFRSREVPPNNGYSVVLSIDSAIQHIVEAEIANITRDFDPQKVNIIVSHARTGFILAMANYPTFDLNAYNQVPKSEEARLRNSAVADYLEPGSTFKIVAASGALNEGLVTPDTHFDCSLDSIDYRGKPRGLPKEDHRFDHPLSVTEIISHSSNKGAAQLGMLLGEERLYNYARAYGFAEYTGFPSVYPETPGLFAHYTKWSGSDITRIPMGHTISATALQIHMAMGVVASGGELLRPQLIREIRNAEGDAIYRFGPSVRRRVISAKTAEAMAAMLHGVTVKGEGNAPEAGIPGFQVAGKTGTAQKIIDGRYSSSHHVGSFVGFFPASRPEVVISIIVDDGKPKTGGIGYGVKVAAPSFRRIGEQLIQYLDIKPVTPEPPGKLLVMDGGRR